MSWVFRYKISRFFNETFWVFPVAGVLLALVVGPLIRWADHHISFSLYVLSPEGARGILGPLVSALFTFVVFVISTLLLVTQLASSNLTPRVIHFVFNDNRGRIYLGIFTFSFTYSVEVLARIDAVVPSLPLNLAIFLNVVSFILFFVFVQNMGLRLQPSVIMENWAEKGRAVIEVLYPNPYTENIKTASQEPNPTEDTNSRIIVQSGCSGFFIAFGMRDMIAEAKRVKGRIQIIPRVGDYVPRGEPMFRVFPANAPWSENNLLSTVIFGVERNVEQDPAYAFRLIVDVASKALSPGVNDPTTAVMALEQIQSLLKMVGSRNLNFGEVRDEENEIRLNYSTPTWEQYVELGISEIRLFGVSSLQIAQRLQVLLDYLMRVLPESRHPPLQLEMELLHEMVKKHYDTFIDQKRARMER